VLLSVLGTAAAADLDGDGYDAVDDCDDADASIHPSADELCNAVDDDCDAGTTDDGVISVEGYAYTTLQDAIDAATSGATVSICAGTYFEHLLVDEKWITLEGVGADATILDGSDTDTIIRATHGSSLTVRGMTLQHGSTTGNGGAIDAQGAKGLWVDDCVVTANHADVDAGGINGPYLGSELISGTVVTDNDAGGYGGGAVLVNRSAYTSFVMDSEFRGNHADGSGGGLGLRTSHFTGRVVFSDTIIDGNTALGTGGGLNTNTGLTLERVTVSNNQASSGAGIYDWGVGGVAADDETEIFGNETYAGGEGGGVFYDGEESASWRGGHIHDNTAARGGGMRVRGWYSAFADAVVEDNHATELAGGILMSGSFDGGIRNLTVRGNTSDGEGGGIYFFLEAPYGSPLLRNCVITENVAATEGGGIFTGAGLQSAHSSWGASPSNDNSPDDILLVDSTTGSTTSFGGIGRAASFICGASTCVDR
jgi:hypothetical protein